MKKLVNINNSIDKPKLTKTACKNKAKEIQEYLNSYIGGFPLTIAVGHKKLWVSLPGS